MSAPRSRGVAPAAFDPVTVELTLTYDRRVGHLRSGNEYIGRIEFHDDDCADFFVAFLARLVREARRGNP